MHYIMSIRERLQADLYHTYNSDWNTATVITGVEDVMVQGNGRRTAVSALRKRQVKAFDNETGGRRYCLQGQIRSTARSMRAILSVK